MVREYCIVFVRDICVPRNIHICICVCGAIPAGFGRYCVEPRGPTKAHYLQKVSLQLDLNQLNLYHPKPVSVMICCKYV